MASDIVTKLGKTGLGRWIWHRTRGPVASKAVGTTADTLRSVLGRMNTDARAHDRQQTELLNRYERRYAVGKASDA